MRKLGRAVLFALVGTIAFAAMLLLGVNMYVQAAGTQKRIQQELSQRLGTALHLRRISVTPWAGLKLSGITIAQANPAVPGEFLSAKTFRLRVEFASLFAQRLVIKEVSLLNPEVFWPQNADGQWKLPGLQDEPVATTAAPMSPLPPAEVTTAVSSPIVRAAELPRSSPVVAAATAPPVEKESEAFTPEVRRVTLKNGNFHFLDEKGKKVATFAGVEFRSDFRNATAVTGRASIAKTSLRDRFFLEDLRSPLRYDPAELAFSSISARVGDGSMNGNFTLRPQAEDSPFAVSVRFENVQADRIMTQAGGPAGVLRGRLEGSLEANGKTADANALAGTGEIFLRDGEVQQYSLLVALGQLLQIEELQRLHLDEAHVKYHLSTGLVTVDELMLRSPNVRFSAAGTITFAGKLKLEAQLALNERIRGQLFRAISNNFQPTEEPGFAAVKFQISGTAEKPKSNLMEKVVGRDLHDIGSVLSGLLGGRSGKKKKNSAPPETVTPATAPSPSPDAEEGSITPTSAPTP